MLQSNFEMDLTNS